MAIKTIIRMGHPLLRRVAIPYPEELIGTNEFQTLVDDMRETLHAHGGIGLAAPQISINYRLAIIEIENTQTRYGEIERTPFDIYINPTITAIGSETTGHWEGCLSVPGMMGFVERPQHIRVNYTDRYGNRANLDANDFMATVFQHEFDHLDGILYVDRIEDKALLAFEEEFLEFHQS